MEPEELEPRAAFTAPGDLDSWNIEDLEGYIGQLEQEIDRVRGVIAHKRAVGDAAEALFRR